MLRALTIYSDRLQKSDQRLLSLPSPFSPWKNINFSCSSEYVDSLASYKRHAPNGGVMNGSNMGVINKSRQQVPPDGASSLNPPRSPRFNNRYRHHVTAAPTPSANDQVQVASNDFSSASSWSSRGSNASEPCEPICDL
jgi:hypothetical protein